MKCLCGPIRQNISMLTFSHSNSNHSLSRGMVMKPGKVPWTDGRHNHLNYDQLNTLSVLSFKIKICSKKNPRSQQVKSSQCKFIVLKTSTIKALLCKLTVFSCDTRRQWQSFLPLRYPHTGLTWRRLQHWTPFLNLWMLSLSLLRACVCSIFWRYCWSGRCYLVSHWNSITRFKINFMSWQTTMKRQIV